MKRFFLRIILIATIVKKDILLLKIWLLRIVKNRLSLPTLYLLTATWMFLLFLVKLNFFFITAQQVGTLIEYIKAFEFSLVIVIMLVAIPCTIYQLVHQNAKKTIGERAYLLFGSWIIGAWTIMALSDYFLINYWPSLPDADRICLGFFLWFSACVAYLALLFDQEIKQWRQTAIC